MDILENKVWHSKNTRVSPKSFVSSAFKKVDSDVGVSIRPAPSEYQCIHFNNNIREVYFYLNKKYDNYSSINLN